MKTITILWTALVAIGLTGCTANVEPTVTPEKSQAQIEEEFLQIADKSCKKAQSEDITVYISNDKPARYIVLARRHAYKNYSAVYIDSAGVAQVIYEAELSVCMPSNLISMQQEANHDNSGDYFHAVKLNADGSYSWTTHVPGEAENVKQTDIFTVSDGVIASVAGAESSNDQSFSYGPVTGDDLAIIKAAVDKELIRIG